MQKSTIKIHIFWKNLVKDSQKSFISFFKRKTEHYILRKWFFIFPCILAYCAESEGGSSPTIPSEKWAYETYSLYLLEEGSRDVMMSLPKEERFWKVFLLHTQKLSIRFHERSKGSNNMKYINKDLDDFVFKNLFDGQGSEVDFVFPLKKYTYIQKDWVDIDSKLSQNWLDNESSLSQKRVKIEVIELMLCKKKMTVLLGWETKKRVSAL